MGNRNGQRSDCVIGAEPGNYSATRNVIPTSTIAGNNRRIPRVQDDQLIGK